MRRGQRGSTTEELHAHVCNLHVGCGCSCSRDTQTMCWTHSGPCRPSHMQRTWAAACASPAPAARTSPSSPRLPPLVFFFPGCDPSASSLSTSFSASTSTSRRSRAVSPSLPPRGKASSSSPAPKGRFFGAILLNDGTLRKCTPLAYTLTHTARDNRRRVYGSCLASTHTNPITLSSPCMHAPGDPPRGHLKFASMHYGLTSA